MTQTLKVPFEDGPMVKLYGLEELQRVYDFLEKLHPLGPNIGIASTSNSAAYLDKIGHKRVAPANIANAKSKHPKRVAVPKHYFAVNKKGRGRKQWMQLFIPRITVVSEVSDEHLNNTGERSLFPDLPNGPLAFVLNFQKEEGLVIRDTMLFGELLEDTKRLMSLGTTTCYRDMVEPHLH